MNHMIRKSHIRLLIAALLLLALLGGCGKHPERAASASEDPTISSEAASANAEENHPDEESPAIEAEAIDASQAGTNGSGDTAQSGANGSADATQAGTNGSGDTAQSRATQRAAELGLPAPPDVDPESWELVLANADSPLPEDYAPEEIAYVGAQGCPQDARIADALTDFSNDCIAAGLPVFLSSGYRPYEEQAYLFNQKVAQYGEEKAATIVLPPGTSEHQTGLCCDITDIYRSPKSPDVLAATPTFQWLNAHCAEYGFILRYPEDKREITNIIYEPWHFRYVGEEAAHYIQDNGLCLEEFLALYEAL